MGTLDPTPNSSTFFTLNWCQSHSEFVNLHEPPWPGVLLHSSNYFGSLHRGCNLQLAYVLAHLPSPAMSHPSRKPPPCPTNSPSLLCLLRTSIKEFVFLFQSQMRSCPVQAGIPTCSLKKLPSSLGRELPPLLSRQEGKAAAGCAWSRGSGALGTGNEKTLYQQRPSSCPSF